MSKATSEYTDFQRKAVNTLCLLAVSLTVVHINGHGKYVIKSCHWFGKLIYIVTTLNTAAKFVYLVLLVKGYFGPVEFLDKMSALLWILMCWELIQNLNIWIRKYPLYEVLSQLWKLENDIFLKLGKPKQLWNKLHKINLRTVVIHTCICIAGDSFLVLQFFAAPKYSVYTYAGIKEDTSILLMIFAFHEFLFLWQCWNAYASIVCLSSINAAELSYTIEAMTGVLNSLLEHPSQKIMKKQKNGSATSNSSRSLQINTNDNSVDPNLVAEGTLYDIETLISDYKKLMLLTDQLNGWCSYKIVGVHAIGYCQFISDVFMMMQLLKLPEFDFLSVLWFLEDSSVCIFMLFRMFSIMSGVTSASESFLGTVRHYLTFDNPIRSRLRRTLRTLKLISIKLGPCPVTPGTVGAAIMLLMNYYVCVALWPD